MLCQKQLTDDEREKIILDSNFHTGQVSFIQLKGILDIDAQVRLKQNITNFLKKLLLSLGPHQSSTITNFFIQVERGNDPNTIVCLSVC